MADKPEKRTFDELMNAVTGGSQEAVWELLDRYSTNILRVVRRHLPDQIRTKVDSVDIVQSVWESLLKHPPELVSGEAFMAYLAAMARNKTLETYRHYTQSQARNVSRELPLASASNADTTRKNSESASLATGPQSSPVAIACARETWSRAVMKHGERAEQVVELRLQGMSLDEIAKHLQVSKSTVRRELQYMLESLLQ
jgi:RNA polymerase sigma factor (sigma-70 family)